MEAKFLNMLDVMKERIEAEIKHEIKETIVKNAVSEYEKKFREDLQPLIDKIVIDRMETIQNVMQFRDELHVFVHHKRQ